MLLHTQEKPGPEHGHQQLPVEFGKWMHLRVASEDFVLIASPGQCEVSHAVVPVARFEVEDAAEPFILEEQVPAREVAVAVDPCSSASNRPRVRRSAGLSSSDAPGNRADQLRNGPALAPQVLLDLQLVANVDWRGVQHQLCFA